MPVDFKSLMLEKIKAADPTIDSSTVSEFSELSTRPFLTFNTALEGFINQDAFVRDIRNFASMTDEDLEALAANFFVTRKVGSTSTGEVSVFFNQPRDFSIPIGQQFISKNGAVFIASQTVQISKSQLSLNFDAVRNSYKLDIPAVTSTGTGDFFNVAPGDIVQMFGQNDNVVEVINFNAFSKSVARETNQQLHDRIINSASMRNLCSADSTTAIMLADPRVLAVSVIGAGDPEMIRDIVFGVHVNGLQDTYIYSSEDPIQYVIESPSSPFPSFVFIGRDLSSSNISSLSSYNSAFSGPVIFVSKIEYGTGTGTNFSALGTLKNGEDFNYEFIGSGSPNNKNSDEEMWRIKITKAPPAPASIIRATVFRAPLVAALQNELLTSGARAPAHSTLYRSPIAALVNITVNIKPLPGASTDPQTYANVLSTLIKNNPISAQIDGSDIIAALSNAGADKVEIPAIISARVLYNDLSEADAAFAETITSNSLERPSIGATGRNIALYPGNIVVTIR